MRYGLAVLMIAAFGTCAAAAPPPAAPDQIQIPPQLTDPATADRVADMMEAMSKALLSLPAGQLEAAAEGRAPTARERTMTVRDLGSRDDPKFERNFDRQIANARPVIRQTMEVFAKSLPAMNRALSEMAEQMRQMTDALPSPQQ
jgi:hypothetical protein